MKSGSRVSEPVEVVAHGKMEKVCWLSRTKVACPQCSSGRMRTKNDADGNVSEFDQCDWCGQHYQYSDIKKLRRDAKL